MNYTVYKHTSPSGKSYIGITNRDLERRWGTDGMYYKGSKLFYNAICKYGWNNIEHEILFTGLSESEAKQKEIELISHYKAFDISYNLTDGGDGSLGLFPNEETRRKIGAASKRRITSEETRNKISTTLKNMCLKRSEETRRKISEGNIGKKRTTEQNERNRLTHLGKHQSKETIEKRRQKLIGKVRSEKEVLYMAQIRSIPIIQLTKEGNFVSFWENSKVAASFLNGNNSTIIACCKGRVKYYKGFTWKYLSEYAN